MSCAIVGLSRCAYYYQPKLQDDSVIVSVLNAVTDRHLRWGFPKCFNRIRKLGYQWNPYQNTWPLQFNALAE
ncbi:hypothetical protein A9G28_00535 [Gilliamella sp. Fer1-1]|jgi:hypothetical protein|uniref:hypothetical protein n=1 Tax=Gilliamella sp. Fer1-1 TaxID=3120240 RepID=UPI00080DE368|nr:hypothetical protein [Gilliamella apicola]OCG44469.1 hypothetical protein A9G28_00535 [Gilliamella apicola]